VHVSGIAQCQQWRDTEGRIIIGIEALELLDKRLVSPEQRLFVTYAFLPELCRAEDQCTDSLPPINGTVQYNFALVRLPASTKHPCGASGTLGWMQ
jgi:hypothetical protein